MNKLSKIYVAGHEGLVGSSIMRKLSSDGYCNVVTRTFKELDLRRQDRVETFFAQERPEYVFLAAAKVGGIYANNTYKAEFIYDNMMISANVIHASYKFNVKKLLNLGSSCIYPKDAPQPLKEEYLLTSSLEPTNEPYAIAKIAAIKLCRYYNEQYGTNFISVMPTNLYGFNDNFNLETSHVLPALIRKFYLAKMLSLGKFGEIRKDFLLQHQHKDIHGMNNDNLSRYLNGKGIYVDRVILWGTGNPYREFLYVNDLASALLFVMKNLSQKDIEEFINIGTGKDLTIKELAFIIKEIVKFDGAVWFDKRYPDGTLRKLLDVSKINKLGWRSSISLVDGIRFVYDHYLKKLGCYSSSINSIEVNYMRN